MKTIDNWGQEVFIPSEEDWNEILQSKLFMGVPLSDYACSSAQVYLDSFRNSPDLSFGFIKSPSTQRVHYLCLLNIKNKIHRVHFEDVICHSCNQRSGMSARPDFQSYICTPNFEAAKKAANELPILNCIHCGTSLYHRGTIWFQH